MAIETRRIIYGVSGEGSGHSSRALEIGRHLLAQGHQLKVVSYDRGYRNLCDSFDTLEIEGLHIVCEANRVRPLKTLWHNIRRGRRAWQRLRTLRQTLREFRPDCVITDFEPSTAWLAKLSGLPLISLDNQHRMRYMHYESPLELLFGRWLTATIIRLMIPAPDVALATTFYFGRLKNDRIFLYPPILRHEVLRCQPHEGSHHLVYMTNHIEQLAGLLAAFPQEQFIVYGSAQAEDTANVRYRPFSKEGFLHDLESCRSVIATAGFTLISEATYLGKPYLAMPLKGQFEQQLNAICLQDMGLGMKATRMDVSAMTDFFGKLPELSTVAAEYARKHHIDDPARANQGIIGKLDELLANIGALRR